jgi:hypothetical protein
MKQIASRPYNTFSMSQADNLTFAPPVALQSTCYSLPLTFSYCNYLLIWFLVIASDILASYVYYPVLKKGTRLYQKTGPFGLSVQPTML